MKSSQMSGYLIPKKNAIKELYWDSLLSDPNNIFDLIYSFYTSKNRYYHNINHIVNCQQQLDGFVSEFNRQILPGESYNDFKEIRLALWFHDIIYDARLNNNEELSAILAKELIRPFSEVYDNVPDLILFTKHNRAAENFNEEVISDIDLSILGAYSREYQKYSDAIRLEYGFVPDYAYYAGRLKILESIIGKEHIYYTEYFRDLYETSARINIREEIKCIKEKIQ
jgi:predicted metal-dependent HD superfamily phosphohydrolase